MKRYSFYLLVLLMGAQVFLTSCGEDEKEPEPEPGYTIPTTYVFTDANGNSTVDYSGQTTRLDKFKILMDEMKTGNTAGTVLDATVLKNMFADNGYDWGNAGLNAATTKKLRDKTKNPDVFDGYIDSLANASTSTFTAAKDTAGVLGNRLLDANGVEYQQVIEKALYGHLFFNQIANVYLTEDKIGVLVSNSDQDPANGKYYSSKEHHWDEAFGYFGAPIDFPTTNGVYIARYSNSRDAILGTNKKIMDAFLKGRAAITNNDATALEEAKAIIYEQIELVFAASAIHYLNGTIATIGTEGVGASSLHQLSECLGFMMCLTVSHEAKTSASELKSWQDTIGANLWEASTDDMLTVRNEIAAKYGISAEDRAAL